MDKIITGLIVVLVLVLVLIIVCYVVYLSIKHKIKKVLGATIDAELIGKGIDLMQKEYAQTPKSVSAATSLCLPRIIKDFPDFHYDEMKERAENVLISFLRSLDAADSTLLTEGTPELRDKLAMQIEMYQRHYESIKVHRTEISQYRKTKGKCGITFQCAVEYIFYTEAEGVVTEGRKDLQTQAKYNVELIYIQDRDLIENTADWALGVNCPNCGAPLSGLGAKVCAYCDSPIVEFNIRAWNFSDVEEVG